MVAGLPGFGLSGAFFVVSALLMLPIEVVATLRGRSSLARWGRVLRSAGIALAIVAGVELTYAALHFVVTQLSGSVNVAGGGLANPHGRTVDVVHTIPVLPILGTLGLVAILTAAGKAAAILSYPRRKSIRPRVHSAAPRSRTPRGHVQPHSPRGYVQPHVVEHEPFAAERQRPLGLASGTSR